MFPKNRPFVLFFVGRTVDLVGSAMTPVVLALAVLQVTKSATSTGLVLAANVLPALIFMLVGGVLADRLPRARILTLTCALAAVVQLAMAAAFFAGTFSLALMAVLSALSGILAAFTAPALRGIVPDLVAEEDLQPANAALAASKNAAKILGPTVAGLLVAFVGGGWALVVDAATSLLAALLFTRLPGYTSARRRGKVLAEAREGFRAFRRLRWVWTLSIVYALINLLMVGPWQVLGPALVSADHSVALWGVILSVRAAGLLVASILMLRLRFAHPLVAGLMLGAMSGLPLLALGVSAPIAVLFVIVFVSAFGTTAANVTYDSALQSRVPRHQLSRVASIDDLFSFATVPLSQALVGFVAGAIGAHRLLLICGVGTVVLHFVPLVVRDVRTVDRRRDNRDVDGRGAHPPLSSSPDSNPD